MSDFIMTTGLMVTDQLVVGLGHRTGISLTFNTNRPYKKRQK